MDHHNSSLFNISWRFLRYLSRFHPISTWTFQHMLAETRGTSRSFSQSKGMSCFTGTMDGWNWAILPKVHAMVSPRGDTSWFFWMLGQGRKIPCTPRRLTTRTWKWWALVDDFRFLRGENSQVPAVHRLGCRIQMGFGIFTYNYTKRS